MASQEKVLEAQLEVLRMELQIKKREAELARLQARRGHPEMSQQQPSAPLARSVPRPASSSNYNFQMPPPKRPRVETHAQLPFAARNPSQLRPVHALPSQPFRPPIVPAHQVEPIPMGRPIHLSSSPFSRELQQVRNMNTRFEREAPTAHILVQYAGNIMYEFFKNQAHPSPEAVAELELCFTTFLERVKAGMEAGQEDLWVRMGQEIKLFFEAGFRIRKHMDFKLQQTFFMLYIDALNLFMPLPEEVPADFKPHPQCWLRPTLALGFGVPEVVRLQNGVVPETLAPSDLLVELYWDLEVDLFRKSPLEVLPQATTNRRKRNVTQIALSILQNCDFIKFQPKEGEGALKAPPVLIVCHSKGMVLKLADTLNYLARFEYSHGYRGAEAAYREAAGLSDTPVSIVVCTMGRLLNELRSGHLSLKSVKLLAFMAQGTLSIQDAKHVRQLTPSTARVMVFHSLRLPIKNGLNVFSTLLRVEPLRLLWEGPLASQFHAEELHPVISEMRSPAPVPAPTPVTHPVAPACRTGARAIPIQSAAQPIAPIQSATQPIALIDFAFPDLDPRIPEALKLRFITQATPFQQLAVPQIMSGENRLFIVPDGSGTVLSFVTPTIHLMLNYLLDPTVRVLVLAQRIEDVDAVVAEYLNTMSFLPDAGLTAEGIHSKRLSAYETPINTNANVIVATPTKMANILRNLEKTISINASAVDVLVLYKLRSKQELRDALDVHRAILAARGSVQVVAFVPPDNVGAVDQLTADICPGTVIIPFEG